MSSMAFMFLHALLLLLIAASQANANNLLATKPGCQMRCGDIDIPYPFGIDDGCYLPGFRIICGSNKTRPYTYLPGTEYHRYDLAGRFRARVLSVSVAPRPEVRVQLPVAYQCFDAAGNKTSHLDAKLKFNKTSAYRISSTANELFVLGCSTFIFVGSGKAHPYFGGCIPYSNDSKSKSAQDGVCKGIGCCNVNILEGLTATGMTILSWTRKHACIEFSPCDYAFIVEKEKYTFHTAHLRKEPRPQSRGPWRQPLILDWAVRNTSSCAQAAMTPGYACRSKHSECVNSTNGPGYLCNCTEGYEGNPYLHGGCTNIDECARSRKEFPCNGICQDTEGSYLCKCSHGYDSNGDPKENPCNPKFPHAARLVLGTGLGVSLIVVAVLSAFIYIQKKQIDKLFEKNGGKILQDVKGLTIFTKEELKKITKDNSEFLGNGSFGEVYKGILPNNTEVAVKASITVNEDTKKEFTEEVVIQTHMIHKNILKLIGCCLEVDVPMLVYEYAANGSVQEILHGSKELKLSLDLRMDIAIGSAEGLKYMHSYTTQTIRHGDIKPDNILLDDKLTPKISDFGLSKLVKEGAFAKKVVGCMGYIDPVFMKTGLLTQKSDVYSFGAVLLELITRKKNVYSENLSLVIEFCKVYKREKSGRAMFDKDIATEEDICILEEVGKLAVECLEEDIEDRPDMTEVAERLVLLRRDRKSRHGNTSRHIDEITAEAELENLTTDTHMGLTRHALPIVNSELRELH